MTRVLYLYLALALALGMTACTTGPALRPETTLPSAAREVPGHYVVVTVSNPLMPAPIRAASTTRGYDNVGTYVAGGVARGTSRQLATEYRLAEVTSWPIALLGIHCIVYAIPPERDLEALLATLARDPRVESAQPLLVFETESSPYNDPYADLQKNVQHMAVADAHGLSRGAGVTVAVIDTGVDIGHEDLRKRSAVSRNFIDTDDRTFRQDVHGTAVAGVIAAVPNNRLGIVGVAPDVRLLTYKACWHTLGTGTRAVCNSFTLALALAAAIEARSDVINLSLSGPSDPLLTRLVKRGIDSGIIFVGAVPPDGTRKSFPTDIDGVIAVDAVENGYQSSTTLRAPGRDVLSLVPGGSYDFYSGSSLAAAQVSGLVALLRSRQPRLTARAAESLLSQSVPTILDAPAAAVPNACAALRTLMRKGGCGAR